MVSVGSKALPLRRPKHHSIVEHSPISGEDSEHKQGRRRRNMGRKSTKQQKGSNGGYASGSVSDKTMKDKNFSKKHDPAEPEVSYVRLSEFYFHVVFALSRVASSFSFFQ